MSEQVSYPMSNMSLAAAIQRMHDILRCTRSDCETHKAKLEHFKALLEIQKTRALAVKIEIEAVK